AVVCFWPWALFAVERLGERRSAGRALILLAVVFSLWSLCRHIESAALGSLLVALWLASRAAMRDLPDPGGTAIRARTAGLLGLGLPAFVLIPQTLALRASNRMAQAEHPFWTGVSSLLPTLKVWGGGLLTPLFPRLFGDEITAPM